MLQCALALVLLLASIGAIVLSIILAGDPEGRSGTKVMALFFAGAAGLITAVGWSVRLAWLYLRGMPWW